MPLYDRACEACGWHAVDVWEPVVHVAPACPSCGAQTARAWLSKPPTAIGDEMDHWQVNGTKEPIHFRSKIARRRWMKAKDYHDATRHVGANGTDKSKHTSNWGARMDPYTANNVRILLERAFKAGSVHDDELQPLAARVYTGELGSAEHEQFVRQR